VEVKSDHGATFTAEIFEEDITGSGCSGCSGCWHTLSAVGRPQGMGRVERYNRKEQRLRWADVDVDNDADLQGELNGYHQFYDERRPHRALGGSTRLTSCVPLTQYRYQLVDILHFALVQSN